MGMIQFFLLALQMQFDALSATLSKLGNHASRFVVDREWVLSPDQTPCDLATTLKLWLEEAIVAGAIVRADCATPHWWDSIADFDSVMFERDLSENAGSAGLAMLGEAYDYLEACLVAGTDEGIKWEMAFKGEVDLAKFLSYVLDHGGDHGGKASLTAAVFAS